MSQTITINVDRKKGTITVEVPEPFFDLERKASWEFWLHGTKDRIAEVTQTSALRNLDTLMWLVQMRIDEVERVTRYRYSLQVREIS